ncbi:hypothetical protein AVEN_193767-1 [Araneus ventricosus]|uniref:TIL domain-containing protein n=1 Tax=Araneus ventricosus TaxID=182803 RepID=A0A4Y2DL05_ARAVE|nr:hypothetical protein AVEN_193767-1 [Araneus ventricosus]
MKFVILLCCVAVVACMDARDFSIDESFLRNFGYDTACSGNKTLTEYSMCAKRCDQLDPPMDCPDTIVHNCTRPDDTFMLKS